MTYNERICTWWQEAYIDEAEAKNPKVDVRELADVYVAWRNTVMSNCATDRDREIEGGRIPQNYYSLIYGLQQATNQAAYNRLNSVYNSFWNFFAFCRERYEVSCEKAKYEELSELDKLTEFATEWMMRDHHSAKEVLSYFRQVWGSKPSEVDPHWAPVARGQLIDASDRIRRTEVWQDAISGPPKPQ